jgi:superfamily II DNA or RNA helicase
VVTILIDNSYSKLSGLSLNQEKALSNLLSYIVGGKSSFYSKYGPKRKSLLSKRGDFPTGLLARVYNFLLDNNIQFERKFLNKVPSKHIQTNASWNDIIPYEDQILALERAVMNGRGVIVAPTGSGKSLIIALIANELKVKTMVVVPSLEIKHQLYNSLKSIFKDMSWISVENIDSNNLKKPADYDCLIIDEAHHVAAKTYQKLNKQVWNNVYYRFFLTATPFRNDNEETLLFESIAGNVIHRIRYQDAVNKGYIVPVHAYYIESPKQETNAYTYAQVYSELVVNNNLRNELITNILKTLEQSNVFTLCLVREIAHGEILSAMTGAPFVSGADESSRQYIKQFNAGKHKVLIGTTGVLGEGIDTKSAEYIVIAGLGKAKSQFMQQVGRGVRVFPNKDSCKVILIKDKSHKFLTRHFNAQSAILLEEYGVKPVRLE